MKNFKLFVAVLLLSPIAKAQQNFTLYNMPSIPQSNLLNPALVPDCKWHVGIPALNSTYFQYGNSGFNANKVFNAMESFSPDSSQLNLNKLLDVFNKKNYIALKVEQSWLSGGVKLMKNHYLHFSVQEKAQVRISIPKDLFTFLIDGNGGSNLGKTLDFDFKSSALHYREFALGYAFTLDDRITVGGRVKYLLGLNVVDVKSANLSVTTNPEDYSYLLKTDIRINAASSLGTIIKTDSTQRFEPQASNFFRTKNKGMALDLGATFKFTDKITFSASLLDMGYIHWKQNTTNIMSHDKNASFKFDGIHVSSADTNSDFNQYIENLVDTLLNTFRVDTVHKSFNTGLSAEFFLGANYELSKRINLGGLFYGDFYNGRFYPGLTLSMRYKLGKALSINVSNTFYNRSALNPGLGVSVNAGAFQVYSVMDNFLFPLIPTGVRNMSWRFGSNITIGRDRLKPRKSKGNETPTDPTTN